jgi:hypothetical protein
VSDCDQRSSAGGRPRPGSPSALHALVLEHEHQQDQQIEQKQKDDAVQVGTDQK